MKIGLSQRIILHNNRSYDSLDQGWYKYLKNHSIIPIPNRSNLEFNKIADTLDVFIITGGDDSTLRRLVEIRLAKTMLLRQKPVIGICHGCFLLTELLGGIVGDIEGHTNVTHQVNYFGESKEVNSYHSLYIQKPHSTATVLANDDQGNCEAWIDKNIAGIVWHPERMLQPWIPDEIEQLLTK
jgi:gamma-glutamyl-gamma-aminobutyrate hydrolase PuuD